MIDNQRIFLQRLIDLIDVTVMSAFALYYFVLFVNISFDNRT